MLCALDVHYEPAATRVAAVEFRGWSDADAEREHVLSLPAAAPYVPGQFYRRELPPLLAVIAALAAEPEVLLVDGHVWLEPGRPGLGAHLHAALGGRPKVVGLAKTAFGGAGGVWREVYRGTSRQALWVDAVGWDHGAAADAVRSMHGPFRLPTLLRRVDQLSRGLVEPRQLGNGRKQLP